MKRIAIFLGRLVVVIVSVVLIVLLVRAASGGINDVLDSAKARLRLGWTPRVDTATLCDRAFAYGRAADDPRKIWYPG